MKKNDYHNFAFVLGFFFIAFVLVCSSPQRALAFNNAASSAQASALIHNWTANSTSSDSNFGNDWFSGTPFPPTDFRSSPVYATGLHFSAAGSEFQQAHGTSENVSSTSVLARLDAVGSGTAYVGGGDKSWFEINSTTGIIHSVIDNSHAVTSTLTITDTNWHSLILNMENGVVYFYLDGVKDTGVIASTSAQMSYAGGGKQFGRQAVTGNPSTVSFTASDYAVFNQSLTTSTIAYLSSGAQSSFLSGQFLFPLNNSSTPDFQNWVLNVLPASSSDIVNVVVNYGHSSSSLIYSDSGSFQKFSLNGVTSTSAVIQKATALQPRNDFSSTSTWYAQASFFENCSGGLGDQPFTCAATASTSIISFMVNPNASKTITSSTVLAYPSTFVFYSSPSSTNGNPYACNGALDLAGCLGNMFYSLAQVFFQPSNSAVAYLNSGVTNFQGVFPFNVMFQSISTLQGNLSSTDISDKTLSYNLTIGSATGTVAFLSSSTLSASLTPNGKIFLFGVEDGVMDILTLGFLFFTPYHWWKRKHHVTNHVN